MRIFISLLIVAYAFGISAAQIDEQQAVSVFAIEVTQFHNGPTAHFLIRDRELKGDGGFTLAPIQILRHAAKDSEQVTFVKIAAAHQKEVWRISVSVVKGQFYDQGEEQIAAYVVKENEKVTVNEIERFGIRPFEVTIVRIYKRGASTPLVTNRTNSISVINLEARMLPSPFRLVVRNLSSKDILALELNTYRHDVPLFVMWPEGTWDQPLIVGGGTFEQEVSSSADGKETPIGYVPEQVTAIEISTLVFTDGTYEGKPYLAMVTKAKIVGIKAQLIRVLPLLQSALRRTEAEDGDALVKLKEELSHLGEDVDGSQTASIGVQFPTVNESGKRNVPAFIKDGLHYVKSTILKELDTFSSERHSTESKFAKEWLTLTYEKYGRWLGSLEQWN